MFILFGKRKRELEQLEEEFERFKACVEERDFLMETGFTTTITDKKLLEELRKTTFDGYSFAEVKEQIFNFDFRNIEELVDKLIDLENKQEILDTYRPITQNNFVQEKIDLDTGKNNKNNKKEGK